MDQFQYIKILPNTIDLSKKLRGINTEFVRFIPLSGGNRELTLKCKLKSYVKPMKDPLGVSPSKRNQGTTLGKEKILLTSVGIELTTSGSSGVLRGGLLEFFIV